MKECGCIQHMTQKQWNKNKKQPYDGDYPRHMVKIKYIVCKGLYYIYTPIQGSRINQRYVDMGYFS